MSKLMVLVVVIAICLGGCAPFPPHREITSEPPTYCAQVFRDARQNEKALQGASPSAADTVKYDDPKDAPCWRSSHETTDVYDLFFVEFDDHGWLGGVDQDRAKGARIKWLMKHLNQLADQDGGTPLSLVVYTHGWHHTAAAGDENVNAFRDLLERAALVEKLLPVKRPKMPRVVGVYIGWRGDSLLGPAIRQTSIWDRKLAAEEVAQGSAQELFANLHNFFLARACHFSETSELVSAGERRRGRGDTGCADDVHMLTIGHSFGALITYRALAGRLMANIAESYGRPTDPDNPQYTHSFGDLVVLINPAFEGVHFEALARAASERTYKTDQTGREHGAQLPTLIILQSEGDLATRMLFPLFRKFTTVFSHARGAAQSEASLHSVGWTDRYVTHRLDLDTTFRPKCTGKPECSLIKIIDEQAWRTDQFKQRYREFGAPRLQLNNGLSLTQCRAARQGALACAEAAPQTAPDDGRAMSRPPFMPIWVVRTDTNILRDHNDFLNHHLVDFLRQIYYTVFEK
jgi:hypothetical protein